MRTKWLSIYPAFDFSHLRIRPLAFSYGEEELNWIIRPLVHFPCQDEQYSSSLVRFDMSNINWSFA